MMERPRYTFILRQPIPAPAASKADLYTYDAGIMRVVDGDTLKRMR